MTEVAFLEAVSGGYFSVLGIRTAVGRGLSSEDDRPGADPAAVLSHSWWQSSFNGDSSVIGTTIYLNFRPFTVVGVASPEFRGTDSGFRPHLWIPFAPFRDRYTSWAARAEDRDVPLVRVYGRLRAGAGEERGLEQPYQPMSVYTGERLIETVHVREDGHRRGEAQRQDQHDGEAIKWAAANEAERGANSVDDVDHAQRHPILTGADHAGESI